MEKNPAYRSILKGLSERSYAPVYWLEGEEPFFIDEIANRLAKEVLRTEAERSFNQQVFYGKDVALSELIHHAKQFPIGGERRLLLVKEAKQIGDLAKKSAQELLVRYLKKPAPSTVLVFCYKGGRCSKFLEPTLQAHAAFLRTKRLYERQVTEWITQRAKEQNLLLSAKAIFMLSEHVGGNLHALSNALSVLALHATEGKVIDDQEVQYYTGLSKEYNIFELQKALGAADEPGICKIMGHMIHHTKAYPPQRIIYGLSDYFFKLLTYKAYAGRGENMAALLGVSPYFLRAYQAAAARHTTEYITRCIVALHQTDITLKGMGETSSQEVALKQLLAQLLGAKNRAEPKETAPHT